MGITKIFKFSVFCLGLALAGASSSANAADRHVTFDHAVDLFIPNNNGLGAPTPYAPNADITLDSSKIYWIQAKGKVPVLVLPQVEDDGKVAVRMQLPDVKAWPSSLVQQEINAKLGDILEDVNHFQLAIIHKDIPAAERALAHLESGGANDYYQFLRATLNFVKGDIDGARKAVKRALDRYPANEQGQKLLKAIGDKSP